MPDEARRRDAPPGWVVTQNSVNWWVGHRLLSNPYGADHLAAGCSQGVISYEGREDAIRLIVDQERLVSEYRRGRPSDQDRS